MVIAHTLLGARRRPPRQQRARRTVRRTAIPGAPGGAAPPPPDAPVKAPAVDPAGAVRPGAWQLVDSWEEYEGSPVYERNRTGMSATRTGVIQEADLGNIADAVFPPPDVAPDGAVTTFPGMDYLYADSMRIEPLLADAIFENPASPLNVGYFFGGYKVTLTYKTSDWDWDAYYLQDPWVPFGSVDSEIWTTWKLGISGEFYTLPFSALQWTSDHARAGANVRAGLLVVQIDHHLTWHFCPTIPWEAIATLVGRVNDDVFLGAPAGTLLLLGAEVNQDIVTPAGRYYTVGFKIAEKNQGDPENPLGWNFFLRPDKEPVDWDKLGVRVDATSERPLLQSGTFTDLFA